MTTNRRWHSGMLSTEDWWAVWVGLALYVASLAALAGVDLVGWMVRPASWEWTDTLARFELGKLLSITGEGYRGWPPAVAWVATYFVFTGLLSIGAWFQRLDVGRFVLGFTAIYLLTWVCWIVGNEMHFSAVDANVGGRNRYQENDLSWGLQLGSGAPYLLALLTGLFIGNFAKGFARFLGEAAKPEWFIKAAIVFLGVNLGAMTIEATDFALELVLTGAAATFVAYLFFWPIVYTMARRLFKLKRDASAVLASGISICGVSAAIATGGAIRARPIVPVTVAMLVVIFAMLELLILPGAYVLLFPDEPIVNGAAMGMTVKTDGADAAAGALLDELMVSRNLQATGVEWQSGWILSASVLTKVWIDVFIGIWTFVLALIWVYKVEKRADRVTVGASEIWFRFPKFVIGYLVAWLSFLAIASALPEHVEALEAGTAPLQSPMRHLMFMLTFVSIGVITDFSKLKGMGRLALLYALALLVVIAPIAYVVAYVFHRGLTPPVQ
ncbi:MAG: putative sulfate exporter family transporter [Gammaproteobacteria bacterium]|nr:putative sulfate exporter family transporter [Gammaproteobacteria bacterium]